MPNLFIDIEGRFAQFNDALAKVQQSTATSAKQMQKSFDNVKFSIQTVAGVLAGLGVGISLKGIVDAADQLNTFSERTDISVKNLQGLTFAAGQFDIEAESLIGSIQKLGRSISEAGTDPNGEKSTLFKTLGLDEAAKGTQDALAAFKQLADVFPRLRDADQSRVAMELLGKSAAELKGLFKIGSDGIQAFIDEGNKLNPVTAEFAKKADAFNDELKKVAEAAKGAGIAILDRLLPPLTRAAEVTKEVTTQFGLFAGVLAGFGSIFKAGFWDQIIPPEQPIDTATKRIASLGREIEYFQKRIDQINSNKVSRFFESSQLEGLQSKLEVRQKEVEIIKSQLENLKNPLRDSGFGANAGPQQPLKLPVKDDGSAKKTLDNQIKELHRFADENQRILTANNQMQEILFKDNLLSIQAFADSRNDTLREGTRLQVEAFNKEEALLRGALKTRELKPTERLEIEDKIKDAISKRAKIESDASVATAKNVSEDNKRYEELLVKVREVNTAIKERQGKTVEAVGERFDASNKDFLERLNAEKRATDIENLARLRQLTVAQAEINDLDEASSRIKRNLSEEEARTSLALQAGAKSEIQAISQISEARKGAVAELKKIADAQEVIARSTGDERQLDQVKALRLEIDKLAASADLFRDKVQSIFEAQFTSFFDKIIDKTASLKEILLSIPRDLAKELLRFSAQSVAKDLFSKEGGLGGLVTGVAGLFGGGGTPFPANAGPQQPPDTGIAASSAAAAESLDALTTSTTASSSATSEQASNMGILGAAMQVLTTLTNLAASTQAKKAAVDAVTSAKGNLFAGGIGSGSARVIPFARGGVFDKPFAFSMAGGGVGVGAESGSEAIMPLTRDSSGRLGVRAAGGGQTVLQTINFNNNGQPVDRRSQEQVAAAAYRGAQSASRSTS